MNEKTEHLKEILSSMGSLAVAFSGGVDSVYLLYIANKVLGDKCVAVTAVSDFFSKSEQKEAELFCREKGIRQLFVKARVMEDDLVLSNPADRCYHCKKIIFSAVLDIAEKEGLKYVADGTNADDKNDYRPGIKALEELGIRSPLFEAGLTKKEIRQESERLGLYTYDKPSFACLASRIPYGEHIDGYKLKRVEEAESCLKELGFKQYRVRSHDNIARIEVYPDDIATLATDPLRTELTQKLKKLGFDFVTLDLEGFRSGSLNLKR